MKNQVKYFSEPQFNRFELAYFGGHADEHRLDMYDASASFYGFSRTIAVLGHYYSTGEIKTHAPRSDIKVFLETSEEGSFKQTVMAAAVSTVVGIPLGVFITRALDTWIPTEDPQTQQIIKLLQEQNKILREQSSSKVVEPESDSKALEKADEFLETNKKEIDVIRSITANSFKDVFRPVGRSADFVGITSGPTKMPIGAVNARALRQIQSDRPDPDTVSLLGVVSSFSRGSKTGVVFSADIGRGFRIEYAQSGKLAPEDDFSWSQYFQRPIRLNGRFVRFFDGNIKKLLVYNVEKPSELETQEYRQNVLKQ